MKTWLIEPRDPLIARDGRPSALGRFESLPFPLPSTIAGAVRTRLASGGGAFALPAKQARELLRLAVHGPLLAELAAAADPAAGSAIHLWAPAPRDAVLFAGTSREKALRRRLAPAPIPAGAQVGDLDARGLAPLQFPSAAGAGGGTVKPLPAPPAFWSWPTFAAWLEAPSDGDELDLPAATLAGLPRERRAHLAIEPGERVGVEGAVFETEGLRFAAGPEGALAPRRLALSLRAEEDAAGTLLGIPLSLREELAPLGGERRLARWRPSLAEWPAVPARVRERIVAARRARLILLTPAYFAAGALPAWRASPVTGLGKVQLTLQAAAVPRAVVVSGWDLAAGQPKPTRRLAPAGSVYFIELAGSEAEIRSWVDAVWLQPVSDDEQARCDGFGIAALGVWPEEVA